MCYSFTQKYFWSFRFTFHYLLKYKYLNNKATYFSEYFTLMLDQLLTNYTFFCSYFLHLLFIYIPLSPSCYSTERRVPPSVTRVARSNIKPVWILIIKLESTAALSNCFPLPLSCICYFVSKLLMLLTFL